MRKAGRFVFAARVGFQLTGGGHLEQSCTATGFESCGSQQSNEDHDDKSIVMFGIDGLIHATPGLRLGLGYQLVPYSAIRFKSAVKDYHLGNEHALNAIIEGLLPLGPRIGFVLRAQAGARMIVIGGDLETSSNDLLSGCKLANEYHCEVDQGPLFGTNFGLMMGVLGGPSTVHWRVDLALDRFSVALPTFQDVSTQGNGISAGATLYGTRLWLLGGVEL